MLGTLCCKQMHIHLLSRSEDLSLYKSWVREHPQGSLWQSPAWKKYQEALGREVRIYVIGEDTGLKIEATALVIIDRTTFGFSTWEIPRGPLVRSGQYAESSTKLLEHIIEDAKQDRCLALSLSPPTPLTQLLKQVKLQASKRHVMPEATRVIALTQPEDAILKQMHQKARYNIHLAERHGVEVERIEKESKPDTLRDALDSFYTLIGETSRRDGFTPLPRAHYEAFLKDLDGSFLLLATYVQKPIAGLMGVIWPGSADATPRYGMYYHGASSYAHHSLMAPSLLQWEAMKYCKYKDCTNYDLFGIAPPGSLKHPWSNVTAFKEKFGGIIVTYPREQMIVLRPLTYRFLKMKRRILG